MKNTLFFIAIVIFSACSNNSSLKKYDADLIELNSIQNVLISGKTETLKSYSRYNPQRSTFNEGAFQLLAIADTLKQKINLNIEFLNNNKGNYFSSSELLILSKLYFDSLSAKMNSFKFHENDFLLERYPSYFNITDSLTFIKTFSTLTPKEELIGHLYNLSIKINFSLNKTLDDYINYSQPEGMVVSDTELIINIEDYNISVNDSLNAKIFLGGYNKKTVPKVYIGQPDMKAFNANKGVLIDRKRGTNTIPILGGFKELPVKNGKGIFSKFITKKGTHTIQGVIQFYSRKGIYYYPFKRIIEVE